MAYGNSNANYGISGVLNQKKLWHEATAKGDTESAKAAENSAKHYYDWLNQNGYKSQADYLKRSDYSTAAQKYKGGKVVLRDYINQLGAGYGLSEREVSDKLKYDNDTGEVSVGGINVGAPIEIDGVSYMDADTLSDAWSSAMERLGIPQSDAARSAGQNAKYDNMIEAANKDFDIADNYIAENRDVAQDYHNEYLKRSDALTNMAKNTDVMSQDWAKSLMGYYNYQGENAANGEKASSAASNGGNIDSYAAANAARQQLSYTNAGTNAVMNNWLQRLGVIQENLNGLASEQDLKLGRLESSVTQQQNNANGRLAASQAVFDNNQTALNNEAKRANDKALNDANVAGIYSDITGYSPVEQTYQYNPYLNNDGTVKDAYLTDTFDADGGFMTRINAINEQLKNENLSASERATLERDRAHLAQARAIKQGLTKYAPYAGDTSTNKYIDQKWSTYTRENDEANRQSAERISQIGADTTKYVADAENISTSSKSLGSSSDESLDNTITSKNASGAVMDFIAWANGINTEFKLDEKGLKYVGGGTSEHQQELITAVKNDKNLSEAEKSAIIACFSTGVAEAMRDSAEVLPEGTIDTLDKQRVKWGNPLTDKEKRALVDKYSKYSNGRQLLNELGIDNDFIDSYIDSAYK